MLWGLGLHWPLEWGSMQGKQMGAQVEEYCVLELTVIHNTSVRIAQSPRHLPKGGRWGSCEQRMFRPWEYKHSTVCDLKRLGWEGPRSLLSIVWTVLSLPKEAPRELPVLCLRAVRGQGRRCWIQYGTSGSCLGQAQHCSHLAPWLSVLQMDMCQGGASHLKALGPSQTCHCPRWHVCSRRRHALLSVGDGVLFFLHPLGLKPNICPANVYWIKLQLLYSDQILFQLIHAF